MGVGSWYSDIGGGMGEALNAGRGNARPYAFRPRHLARLQKQWALKIVVEGDPALINR